MNTFFFFSQIGQISANSWKRGVLTSALGILWGCGSASAQAPEAGGAPPSYGGAIHTITEVWNKTPYPTDLRWYFTDANRRAGYYDPQDLARYNALRKNLKDSGATFNYSMTEARPGVSFRSVTPQMQNFAPQPFVPSIQAPVLYNNVPPLSAQGLPASPAPTLNPADFHLSSGNNQGVILLGIQQKDVDPQQDPANYRVSNGVEPAPYNPQYDPSMFHVTNGATPGGILGIYPEPYEMRKSEDVKAVDLLNLAK